MKPIIIENSDSFEGVYALDSGSIPDYTVDVLWINHNSGSHSDLSVRLKTGNSSGEYIQVTVIFIGKGIIEKIGGYSGGYTDVKFSNNTIIFTRNQHFNPNENFEFGFNNVVFTDTGDGHEDPLHKGSYYIGNGEGYLGSAIQSGDFIVNVTLA